MKSYISHIIRMFAYGSFSALVVNKVHMWMIDGRRESEKSNAMKEVWDRIRTESSAGTGDSFSKVSDMLGIPVAPRKTVRISLGRKIVAAAAVLLLLFLGGGYYYTIYGRRVEMVEVSASGGVRRQLFLPDSSEVWLNSGSAIRYVRDFKGDARTVELTGEAFFSVRKNGRKPFIVSTEHLSVTALGTEFNVNAYPCDDRVSVALYTGKIRVDVISAAPKGQLPSYTVDPSQELVYNLIDGTVRIDDVLNMNAAGWRSGALILMDKTFMGIVNAFGRYYDVSFELDPVQVPQGRYSIKFINNETIGEALSLLQNLTGGFEYTLLDGTVSIRTTSNQYNQEQ